MTPEPKKFYYYASAAYGKHNSPLNSEDAIRVTDCTVTEGILRLIVQECAVGRPPYHVEIDRDVIWRLKEMNLPNGLFDFDVRDNTSVDPLGSLTIHFAGVDAILTYRRCIYVEPMDWSKVEHFATVKS